jgi:hypothetical protein
MHPQHITVCGLLSYSLLCEIKKKIGEGVVVGFAPRDDLGYWKMNP